MRKRLPAETERRDADGRLPRVESSAVNGVGRAAPCRTAGAAWRHGTVPIVRANERSRKRAIRPSWTRLDHAGGLSQLAARTAIWRVASLVPFAARHRPSLPSRDRTRILGRENFRQKFWSLFGVRRRLRQNYVAARYAHPRKFAPSSA